jgi:DNA-binding transcriptional regulator GbsR (MarR family)
MKDAKELEAHRARLVEAAGRLTQGFGLGRNIGQVYMHTYLSSDPQALDDLVRALGISKGSTSMIVRQLEGWGALRPVWRKGDRRDFYEAAEEFGLIVRRALQDVVGRSLENAGRLLGEVRDGTQGRRAGAGKPGRDEAFFRKRVEKIEAFRQRALFMWNSPVAKMLLK